jgi:hypothetical protein
MKNALLLLSTAALMSYCNGNLIDTDIKSGLCEGSVTLYEGSEKTVITEYMNVKVTVDKVMLEGCGCYSLTSRKNGRGKSYFLSRRGEHSVEDIGWSKVRSVSRVDCATLAMPVWGVILIVVGLVVLVAVGALLFFKKYQQYRKVTTNESV